MTWGGMPQRFMMTDEIQTRTYLSDIYNSILVKDISQNGIIHKNVIDWLLEEEK